jgi:hypothetical protein
MGMKDLAITSFQLAKSELSQPVPRKSSPFHDVLPRSGCYKGNSHGFFDGETILRISSITTHKNAEFVS